MQFFVSARFRAFGLVSALMSQTSSLVQLLNSIAGHYKTYIKYYWLVHHANAVKDGAGCDAHALDIRCTRQLDIPALDANRARRQLSDDRILCLELVEKHEV